MKWETEADEQAEDETAEMFMLCWPRLKISRRSPDRFDRIDRKITYRHNGREFGRMEIKNRDYTMADLDAMGGFFTSLDKYKALLAAWRQTGLPSLIGIRDKDGRLWWHQVDGGYDKIGVDGRRDRPGDPKAIEMVVYLKAHRWQPAERPV